MIIKGVPCSHDHGTWCGWRSEAQEKASQTSSERKPRYKPITEFFFTYFFYTWRSFNAAPC
jgi:hypothetical protein